ncbi:hypothetical protein BJF85_15920 [Saccharomonospora sp. CUA-673]|nr:hypothetical protein BJF85_15920 [Saccharomonospora sp. CUA-673]
MTQEVRRSRIIEAAIDCLARDGWHGTTLGAIAREAGISRSLISYHFAGRDDLHRTVLEEVATTVFGTGSAEVERAIDAESTARGKLQAYIAANLRFMGTHRREMAALTELLPNLRRADGTHRYADADEEPVIAGTAALFEHGVATGEFRTLDARMTAYSLRRCIDGAARKIVADPAFDIDRYIHELTRLFLEGVRA